MASAALELGIDLAKEACMYLGQRHIGADQPPFVIAEIGINHEGSVEKARRMIDDAKSAGCEKAFGLNHCSGP